MLNPRQRVVFLVFFGILAGGVLAAFIAIIVAIAKAAHRPKVTCVYNSYRLPTWVAPYQYDLTLDVSMDSPAYAYGEVVARLNMSNQGRVSNCVYMHASDMQARRRPGGGRREWLTPARSFDTFLSLLQEHVDDILLKLVRLGLVCADFVHGGLPG